MINVITCLFIDYTLQNLKVYVSIDATLFRNRIIDIVPWFSYYKSQATLKHILLLKLRIRIKFLSRMI